MLCATNRIPATAIAWHLSPRQTMEIEIALIVIIWAQILSFRQRLQNRFDRNAFIAIANCFVQSNRYHLFGSYKHSSAQIQRIMTHQMADKSLRHPCVNFGRWLVDTIRFTIEFPHNRSKNEQYCDGRHFAGHTVEIVQWMIDRYEEQTTAGHAHQSGHCNGNQLRSADVIKMEF